MKAILAVARREVAERARLFPLALVAGLLPLALPYLGWRGEAEARAVFGAVAAFAVTTATALLAGGSVIGRDLSERRLGFFLARPIGAGSLWAGKMLGAVLLTAVTLVLSSLSLARAGLPPAIRDHAPQAAGTVALALVALIGLAHAASVGYRSRSPWFALDLLLAAGTAAWVATMVVRWRLHQLVPPVVPLLALAAVALTVAGAAQLAVGRVDARRGHAALSLVLWAIVGAGMAAFEARARWLFHPPLADLLATDVLAAAPRGDWAMVMGPARGRGPALFLFVADARGRGLRLEPTTRGAVFAKDGRRAAWLSVAGPGLDETHVSVVDLDDPALRARKLTLPWRSEPARPIALSPDGSRLLALQPGAVVVVDLDGSRSPVRAALPDGATWQATFLDDDRARVFHNDPAKEGEGTLRILDLDVASGALREASRLRTRGNGWVRVSPDGRRILVIDRADRGPSLALHGADGSRLVTLVAERSAHGVQGDFLADGRVVVVQRDPGPRLRVFSAEGIEERVVELGGRWGMVMLGGEIGPGRQVVGLGGPVGYEAEAVLVDVAAGRVAHRQRGLRPVAIPWFAAQDAGSSSRPAPGSPAASLFRDDDKRVVRVDLATGAREVMFGAGARRP